MQKFVICFSVWTQGDTTNVTLTRDLDALSGLNKNFFFCRFL